MVALATGPRVETPDPLVTSPIRRFSIADLNVHGAWILKRLQQTYPHQSDRALIGWLRNIMFDNQSLFLYQDNGVCLFQVINIFALALKPLVIERFVFAKEGYAKDGAAFYDEAAKWAKLMAIEQVIVEQMSDVPHELIQEKLGRLYTRQQIFARL